MMCVYLYTQMHTHTKTCLSSHTLGNFFITGLSISWCELREKSKMVTVPASVPGKHILKGNFLKTVGVEITADSIIVVGIVREELLLWSSDES